MYGKQTANKSSKSPTNPTSYWACATSPSRSVLAHLVCCCQLPCLVTCQLFSFFFPRPAPSLEGLICSTAQETAWQFRNVLLADKLILRHVKNWAKEKRLVRRWRAMFDLKHRRHGQDRVALVVKPGASSLLH